MLLNVSIPGYQAENEESTAYFLILMIIIFSSLSMCFLLLLLANKLRERSRRKRSAQYTPFIDKALLGMLFEDQSIESIRKDTTYKKLIRKRFFRQLLLENVMKLHTNFTGDYEKKLELFYRDAGLDKLSFRKINRVRWHIRCEGVGELSRMKVQEAFPRLLKLANARNNTLKLEVMLGIIRLRGVNGLMIIADHKEPINDWIQLNIISVVKNAGYTQIPDFGKFLESENESIVVLGMRLISTFSQFQHAQKMEEIISASSSRRILIEGERAMKAMSFPTNSNGSI